MFHWTLHDLDHTDIESLIPFVFRYPRWKKDLRKPKEKSAYADQIKI
jgi:hypothetical protein